MVALTTSEVQARFQVERPTLNSYVERGWVVPSEAPSPGIGRPRLFGLADVVSLLVIRDLKEVFATHPKRMAEVGALLRREGPRLTDGKERHLVLSREGMELTEGRAELAETLALSASPVAVVPLGGYIGRVCRGMAE